MIWPGQASEHDADHGEAHKGGDGVGVALEVAREAAVTADPRERALHDPTFGEHLEVMESGALDDLEFPVPGGGDGSLHLWSLVSTVAIDQRDEGEQAACAAQHGEGAVTILHVGGMNDDAQEKAERIDEDVPLAARDLLTCIKALRVECRAPF